MVLGFVKGMKLDGEDEVGIQVRTGRAHVALGLGMLVAGFGVAWQAGSAGSALGCHLSLRCVALAGAAVALAAGLALTTYRKHARIRYDQRLIEIEDAFLFHTRASEIRFSDIESIEISPLSECVCRFSGRFSAVRVFERQIKGFRATTVFVSHNPEMAAAVAGLLARVSAVEIVTPPPIPGIGEHAALWPDLEQAAG